MEIAVGFHSLTTSAHRSNVKRPSSGQQVTARRSARKVSVARGVGVGGGQGPRPPGQGHNSIAVWYRCMMYIFIQMNNEKVSIHIKSRKVYL